jgi:hypothetical protein
MTSKTMTSKQMAGDQSETPHGGKPTEAPGRQARLEQALRANLLKRKAKARAAKSPRTPPEEGRQT